MINAVATQAQRPKFSVMISTPGYQKMINNTLRDPKRAQRFVAAITSAVATNPALQECDPATILSGALLGESLGLSPSPQLGQYYLVPFNNTKKGCKDAQFQLGYKGYVQLALRSGYYKHLNVIAVKAGELVHFNPLTEEIEINLNEDELAREASATIGYLAMFEYLNGFRKTIYWSREKMEAHALRYSKGYAAKKGYTFWEKDFDAMAFKTMLRQIISKWGIMSVELQTAFEADVTDEADGAYLQADEAALPGGQPAELSAAPQEADGTASEEQVSLDDV
ncbi:recombinase RecT [Intestinimonas massiliensis]|uniref:Recombinase RecT n=1 Tax=Intestinimonas massiliensis (ex Afouda et al. 2020) TaxID=1673721 RepID=A0AAW5JJV6_9FIRM|nr:recombinase RecT [Intestinimonas massiliensis (ex Afouda et al. 2020)]MCQ4769019.1 recombinase RecT [Intestinimonas massiliensis (ex Afouda et al. 2020)]MCQ4769072.1 recombinase RecT [Intestinimonas massiliensis (ex Afouda et al. 2020)]